MHLPPARPPWHGPRYRGWGPPSLQRARLFRAIVSLLPGGQVALSSAPVSHDSHRNSTRGTEVGWEPCPTVLPWVGLCPPVSVSR